MTAMAIATPLPPGPPPMPSRREAERLDLRPVHLPEVAPDDCGETGLVALDHAGRVTRACCRLHARRWRAA